MGGCGGGEVELVVGGVGFQDVEGKRQGVVRLGKSVEVRYCEGSGRGDGEESA